MTIVPLAAMLPQLSTLAGDGSAISSNFSGAGAAP
jgi:hypothetical protein